MGERVIFVSKDINSRLKADALGIEVMDFEKQKCNFDELYTGWTEKQVPADTIDEFYKSETLSNPGFNFLANEFVILRNERQSQAFGSGQGSRTVLPLPISNQNSRQPGISIRAPKNRGWRSSC